MKDPDRSATVDSDKGRAAKKFMPPFLPWRSFSTSSRLSKSFKLHSQTCKGIHQHWMFKSDSSQSKESRAPVICSISRSLQSSFPPRIPNFISTASRRSRPNPSGQQRRDGIQDTKPLCWQRERSNAAILGDSVLWPGAFREVRLATADKLVYYSAGLDWKLPCSSEELQGFAQTPTNRLRVLVFRLWRLQTGE
jgi:hypothetical protein